VVVEDASTAAEGPPEIELEGADADESRGSVSDLSSARSDESALLLLPVKEEAVEEERSPKDDESMKLATMPASTAPGDSKATLLTSVDMTARSPAEGVQTAAGGCNAWSLSDPGIE